MAETMMPGQPGEASSCPEAASGHTSLEAFGDTHAARERAALRIFSQRAGTSAAAHGVVREPKVGVWYDWAHPETRRVGQCCLGLAGWQQAPDESAVILAWMPAALRAEHVESFLALWQRSIELSAPERRDALEAERAQIWSGDNRTAATACAVLSSIVRQADKSTVLGVELALAARSLRRSLTRRPASATPAEELGGTWVRKIRVDKPGRARPIVGKAHTMREHSEGRWAVCGTRFQGRWKDAPAEAEDCANCVRMRGSETARGERRGGS